MRRTSEWRRVGPPIAVIALTLAVAVIASAERSLAQKPSVTETEQVEVLAQPIEAFDRQHPDRRQFGRLEWRGGLVLSSSSRSFGGWSGLSLDKDGRRLLAISDSGTWMVADLIYNGSRPARISNAKIGPLRALDGSPLTRNRDRDAESLAMMSGNLGRGTVLIGFELNYRIGQFDVSEDGVRAPRRYLKRPAEAKAMKPNSQFEAVAVLQGGRFKGSPIAIAERLMDQRGLHTGWIWVDDEPRRLYLTDVGEFDITDAEPLRDGSLLVLERRFRWSEGVKMRLRLISPEEIGPGAVMQGEVLLQADMAYQIDNMEAVAVHYGPRGEPIITLMSDDNFNSLLQRTVMLQFALGDNGPARAGQ